MQYVLTSFVPGEDAEIVSDPLGFKDGLSIFAATLKIPEGELTITEGTEQTATISTGEEVTLRPAEPDDLVDLEDGVLNLDAIVSQFSQERFQIAFSRAIHEFGGIVADYEDEAFVEEFVGQLKVMAAQDIADSLVRNHMAKPAGITDDGVAIVPIAA